MQVVCVSLPLWMISILNTPSGKVLMLCWYYNNGIDLCAEHIFHALSQKTKI